MSEVQPCRWCFQPVTDEDCQCVRCRVLYREIKARAGIAARMLVEVAREEERRNGR